MVKASMLLDEEQYGPSRTSTDKKRGDRLEPRQIVAMAPAMDLCRAVDTLFFVIIIVIPFMLGMYYSFTEWNGAANQAKWVGLDNFSHILQDDEKFRTAFWFTVRFTS
jgi:ABC-type sugar transport system permease subunit